MRATRSDNHDRTAHVLGEDCRVGKRQQRGRVEDHDIKRAIELCNEVSHSNRTEQLTRVRRNATGGKHKERGPAPRLYDVFQFGATDEHIGETDCALNTHVFGDLGAS